MITKYSQLYLSAATKEQINSVAKKLGKSPEEIVQLVAEADISGKKTYEVWLLKQLALNNIILPEDAERVKKTLRDFEQLNNRNQLKYKNINQYPKIHDLEAEIRELKGDNLSEAFSFDVQKYLQLPGVEVYGQNSDWLILKVSNAESLTKTSDSTEWCTLGKQWATKYITEDGFQCVVFKKENGKLIKYAQFSPDFTQFKDIHDEEIMELPNSLYDIVEEISYKNSQLIKRMSAQRIFKILQEEKEWVGNLILNNKEISFLPDDIIIRGNLEIYNTPLQKLPQRLIVEDNLKINKTRIKEIPADTQVYGSLMVSRSPIKSIPANVVQNTGATLDFYNSEIEFLPDNLTVDRLWIYSKIKKLPAGLTVNKELDVSNCEYLEELPEDIILNGNLDICDCYRLKKLPAKFTVGGELKAQNCTALTTLPEGLQVGGGVAVLFKSSIRAIPEGFTVKGILNISKTPVESIPREAHLGGVLYAEDCKKLISFPADSNILENCFRIYLSGCENLTSLPNKIGTLGDGVDLLDITNTNITKLPDSLELSPSGVILGVNPLTKKQYMEEYLEKQKRRKSSLRKLIVK